MSAAVETARQEWEEGSRRLAAAPSDERLRRQVELLTDELRRWVGQSFTLEQLAAEYQRAERWTREVIEEHGAFPGWPRTLSLVEQAAFHAYARGAVDYAP